MMDFDTRLLVKYLVEELSSEELEELMTWKNHSEENERIFNSLIKLRISHRFLIYNTPEKTEDALKKVNRKIDLKKPAQRLSAFFKYAAIFILLTTLSYGGWRYLKQPESYLSIMVRDGEEIKKITLNDGTIVWLNKGASLRIPDSFSARNRRIFVDGEVYFDVKRNPEAPFLVETEQLNVKVLGTSFNLNTGINGEMIETILVTGKVTLQSKNNNFFLEMSPGEKVSFSPGKNEYVVETVDVNICTAWHLGQLKFESVTLREIANKLSILYDVNVNLESKKLAERKFRCVINRDEGLQDILNHLEYIAPIYYKIEGKEVFIYELKN